MTADEHRELTYRVVRLKLRQAMLCAGMTPEKVDRRLNRRRGWTRNRIYKTTKRLGMRDMADIALACRCELRITLEDAA